jgi:prolyl-tRNA synthetase
MARRDIREKLTLPQENLISHIEKLLEEIQQAMFQKALHFRDTHITRADTIEEFEKLLDDKGGFISAHWDGTPETEEAIKEKFKATIRCIPLNNPPEEGVCIYSGRASKERVLFARAY